MHLVPFACFNQMWEILPYCMAKAGLDIMTKCLSLELAKKGVRVNAIAPAALRSRFNMRFGDIFTSEDQLKGVSSNPSSLPYSSIYMNECRLYKNRSLYVTACHIEYDSFCSGILRGWKLCGISVSQWFWSCRSHATPRVYSLEENVPLCSSSTKMERGISE